MFFPQYQFIKDLRKKASGCDCSKSMEEESFVKSLLESLKMSVDKEGLRKIRKNELAAYTVSKCAKSYINFYSQINEE